MESDKTLNILVGGFVTILIAVVFLQVVADGIAGNTDLSGKTNESITITSGTGATRSIDLTSVSYFGNDSNSCCNTATNTSIVIGTHVNYTKNGTIQVARLFNVSGSGGSPMAFANGAYGITYKYEGDLYVDDSTSRVLIKVIPIFIVIAILLVGYVIVKQTFPDLF